MDGAATRRTFLQALGAAAGGLALGSGPAFGTPGAWQTAGAGPLVSRLAEFAVGLRFEALPAKAIDNAKAAIRDCLAVTVAGRSEESTRIAAALVRAEGGKPEATVIGQRLKATAMQGAFLNGVASHAHDFDHSFVVGGQPTSPIVSAVMAQGELTGVGGRRLLEAYASGFEIVAGLMFAAQGAGGAGWHANGTVGVFGAAAGCAKLLGLSQPQTEIALAIAASMAGGVQSNFGTMTKPLHVGNAARNGMLAARLAQAGFTANVQTLEAANGYFASYYPGGKVNVAALEELGRAWALERYGVRFKPYPCGGLTHTSIFAAIELRNENAITPELVERVTVEVPTDTAAPLVYVRPRNGLEGKFSMPYLIARALLDGNVTLDTFTDAAVVEPAVLTLLERIEMRPNATLQSGTDGSRPAIVTVRLKDGRTLARQEHFPKGSPQTPMSRDELLGKFRTCVRGVVPNTKAERALVLLDGLENAGSVRALTALLQGG
jgi:2-methylcitrate dehydratase PrpD